MRKILILLLILALGASSLASCGKKDKGDKGDENPPVTDNGDTEKAPEEETEEEQLPGVDFLNEDLSDYIEIDEKYYKNFTVTLDLTKVKTIDVENSIIQTLCKHKSKETVDRDGVISVGDVVHIYYKGYYMKDGEPYYFSGGDNTASGSPHKLEIGSGGFVPGFEYNLIGLNPSDFTEENPIVVEAFFPEDYRATELAGKTAYFIVTVVDIDEYDAPELDDAFITETLKMGEEDLASYKGDTLAEKYRAYVRKQIFINNEGDVETHIMDAFWNSVMEGGVVKKYPEQQVKEGYDTLVYELEFYYSYYSSYYEYDEFMCLYIGLEVGSDWKSYVMDIARSQVKQQLIFYHIMNVEGFKPTEEEYNALFDEYLTSSLASNNITPDQYETEEEYLAAKEKYKNQLITNKGEDYFKSMFYYNETVKGIKEFAIVVEITE